MTHAATILYDVAEGVATITLNRPESRNAFGGGMGDEPTRNPDPGELLRAAETAMY